MRRPGLWLAIALVLAADAVALLGVAQNRRGEPSARLTLTERELPLIHAGADSTALTLRLQWSERGREEGGPGPAAWFDRAKLESIGFDCSGPVDPGAPRGGACHGGMPRQVWLALEYEGPAWQAWLAERQSGLTAIEAKARAGEESPKEVESARAQIDYFMRSQSRLMAIDAGNDAAALARRYADRGRYAIVAAMVRPRLAGDPPRPVGSIVQILVSDINVPAAHRGALEALPAAPASPEPAAGRRGGQPAASATAPAPPPRDPRYEVSLCFGSRHEPWIEQVRPLPSAAPEAPPIDIKPPAR